MKFSVLKEAAVLWYDKDADHAAAAVSYYAIFAIVPLVVLSLIVGSIVYEEIYVTTFLISLGAAMGDEVLMLMSTATDNLAHKTEFFWFPFLGATFFSGMVVVLCNTLTSGMHHLWSIPHQGFKGWIKKCSNAVIFITVFELYIICIVAFSIALQKLHEFSGAFFGSLLDIGFFIAATTVLFSLAYRILPWVKVSFRSRFTGAFVAAACLTFVKVLVSWYLSITPFPGLFEAAGIIIVLLMWGYATACVFFYGAAVAYIIENNG